MLLNGRNSCDSCNFLAAIGSNCLQLRNLALSEMCHITVTDNEDELFRRLEALELWALDGVPLSAAVIRQLIKSCHNIKNILFRGCDAVNDDLFAQLWKVSASWPRPPMLTAVKCFLQWLWCVQNDFYYYHYYKIWRFLPLLQIQVSSWNLMFTTRVSTRKKKMIE